MTDKSVNSQSGPGRSSSGRGIYQPMLGVLASSKMATVIGSLIVLACIAGTVLPQGVDVSSFAGTYPGWEGPIRLIDSVGLTRVFGVWWFIVLLILFSINISACLVRRMSASLRAGRMGVSGWGFLLTHVSMVLILGGAVIGGVFGVSGHMNIREGQTITEFAGTRGRLELPFAVRLLDFGIEYYEQTGKKSDAGAGADTLDIASADLHITTQLVFTVGVPVTVYPDGEHASTNALHVLVSRHVPDFVIDTTTKEISSRSGAPNNPAIFVSVNGPGLSIAKWLFARHPGFEMSHPSGAKPTDSLKMVYRSGAANTIDTGATQRHIKSYKSMVQLLEAGKVVVEAAVEVNHPVRHKGYTLYQSGYNQDDLTWSTLQIVKDPGVPAVYAGFICLIGGLILLLGFKPAAKRTSDATRLPVGEKRP
ncbi:MAG: cytochrome c biogenesis protein ResB [bacterium]